MNWYLTKIVYRIICGNGEHAGQFDEQLRLVFAINKESAFEKAQFIGKQEEEVFLNQSQQLVRWQFINVCEVYKLGNLVDGAVLYSRIEEYENADAYMDVIHKRSQQVLLTDTLETLDLV